MDAIPFGIYFAHSSMLSANLGGRWCYFQLLHRLDTQTYAVCAAATYSDLIAAENDEPSDAIVTTISRKNLHQSCTLIASPHAEPTLYAAPDCVLAGKRSGLGKELQFFASSAWLCYFNILHTRADGSVCIRVAALPQRLHKAGHWYVTYLSRTQFAMALPLERQDLALATCDLLEKVERHAIAASGRFFIEHDHPPVPFEEEKQKHVDEDALPVAQQPQAQALEAIYVPGPIWKQTVERFKKANESAEHIALSPKTKQKIWLQAALLALQAYKERADHAVQKAIGKLDALVRNVLVNHLSNSLELVRSEPVINYRQTQGYVVRIEHLTVA